MISLFNKNGNAINIPLEEDLNKKIDIYAKWIDQLPSETDTSYLFYACTNLTDQYGLILPIYSRGIFINHISSDGVLIAVDSSKNLYVGFRNNGNWSLRKI